MPNDSIINFDAIPLLSSKPDMRKTYFNLVIQDISMAIIKMEEAIKNNNINDLKTGAHSIKGMLGGINNDHFLKLYNEFEKSIANGNIERILDQLFDFKTEFSEIKKKLEKEIE